MASVPQGLPLLYKDLVPLSSQVHGEDRVRPADAKFLKTIHAVPLLSEEFVLAQRHFPIVFSAGPDPVPLALFSLDEGQNVFVDEDGRFPPGVYVPAYVRRYPFILARLRPDTDDLSLCFDPTAEAVGDYAEGLPIFVDGEPSERTKEILAFAESFEQSSQMTAAFLRELSEHKLLIDGEFTVQPQGQDQPHVYRGFQMVSEDAVKALRGDIARKLIQNGAMPLLYAHFFSLQRMGELFGRQAERGLNPALSLGMV
jgi:hypothetical protein